MKNEITKRFITSIILIPIIFFIVIKGSLYFNLFLTVCFLIAIFEWYKMNNGITYFIVGLIFLFISFYLVYLFRNYGDINLFLLTIIICMFTDIGGYIFGKTFNGPKLTKISPNKTYSGSVGSFFLSLISAYLFLIILNYFGFNNDIKISIELFAIIILISLISQVGDLIVSFFKRKSKIKNTGNIIPGHGGLLDRIDGMIFAFPFAYIILRIVQ